MAGPTLVRIDYRLLHGMVVTGWVRSLGIKRICIFDDTVINDPFMQDIFNMAKPETASLEFFSLETAAQKWQEGYFEEKPGEPEMILLRNIYSLDKVTQLGVRFPKVVLGNMESAPKKKCINRVCFMDEDDARILNRIAADTELILQEQSMLTAIPWSKVKEKNFKKL